MLEQGTQRPHAWRAALVTCKAPHPSGSLERESSLPELRNVGWPVWRWLAQGGAQTKPDSWAAGSYGHPGQKVAHPVHGLH